VVGLNILDSFPGKGEKYFFSPNHPFHLWGSPILIISMCQQPFPQGSRSLGMKLTTHLPIVPSLRMSGAILMLPLFAFMSWKGTTSHFCFFFSVTCMVHFNLPLVSKEFIPLCCDKLDVIYILILNTANLFIKFKIACYIFQLSWTYFRYKYIST